MKEREFNFDLERMKEALKGPFITIPHGQTREERRAFIIAHAETRKKEAQ